MLRSLNSALGAMKHSSNSKEKANADDPVVRLRSLEKEASALLAEVNDIRTKNDKAERFDSTTVDRLETSVTELNTRVEAGLQSTASARSAPANSADSASTAKKKKKGKLFGLLGGSGDKYEDLTGAAVVGRDSGVFEV